MKPLLANNKFRHGLTVRLISSLKFASGGSKRRNGSHSGKQDSSREYHGWSSTAGEERGAHSPYHISVTCSVLGEEELLKLSSTIHKFMPVELFLLEENQITHTFWKLLVTASQSASGWLSVMICIFIYFSYIKKFPPVRSWQSVSIFNLFRENSLLADIIQISFYQKSGWQNRWGSKKYASGKHRILMRDRGFCMGIKGMEIKVLIPVTLNCS